MYIAFLANLILISYIEVNVLRCPGLAQRKLGLSLLELGYSNRVEGYDKKWKKLTNAKEKSEESDFLLPGWELNPPRLLAN
jgi:hypothetical protein